MKITKALFEKIEIRGPYDEWDKAQNFITDDNFRVIYQGPDLRKDGQFLIIAERPAKTP